jgi:hypothetical protein
MPEHVNSEDEIVQNVLTFNSFKTGGSNERRLHARSMKNVKYFVVVNVDEQLVFAPGNFSTYRDNSSATHRGIGDRSGGEPVRIISKILQEPMRSGDPGYELIDESYIAYCTEFGVTPSRHFQDRSYWVIDRDGSADAEIEKDIEEVKRDPTLSATEKDALIKARRGQGRFRSSLKKRWGHACAVTGCKQNEILRASHIKGWKHSRHEERRDSRNGLLLSANLDALFDNKLISFEDNGEMIVSMRITIEERTRLGIPLKLRLPLCAEEKAFLNWHRTVAREMGKL